MKSRNAYLIFYERETDEEQPDSEEEEKQE